MFKQNSATRRRMLLAVGALALGAATPLAAADLKIATNQANVPFEFENQEGKTVGFEIDLINEIAKRLGKTVEVTPMPFNSLFAAVQSGRADIALGAITITPKRLESVSFAQPYYDSDQCVTVGASSPIKDLDGIKGKTVGAETGSTAEMWAKANEGTYKFADIRRYEGIAPAMLDVRAGRLDADIHDCPIAQYYIKDKKEYKVVATIPTGERYSMMLSKNSALLNPVNEQIGVLKKDGTLASLHKKWFGTDAPSGSSTVTSADIPKIN